MVTLRLPADVVDNLVHDYHAYREHAAGLPISVIPEAIQAQHLALMASLTDFVEALGDATGRHT